MKIFKFSAIGRVTAVLRYLLCRLALTNFSASGLCMFGADLRFYAIGSISFGSRVFLDDFVEIQSRGNLSIGSGVHVNRYSKIISFEKILIGDNVLIGQFVSLIDHDHAANITLDGLRFSGYNSSPIIVGSNVWIGEKVTILKGVTIGDNVIIGAGAIVTKDISSNSIALGIPAKVVRKLISNE